jgi:hypothetical protein
MREQLRLKLAGNIIVGSTYKMDDEDVQFIQHPLTLIYERPDSEGVHFVGLWRPHSWKRMSKKMPRQSLHLPSAIGNSHSDLPAIHQLASAMSFELKCFTESAFPLQYAEGFCWSIGMDRNEPLENANWVLTESKNALSLHTFATIQYSRTMCK